MSALAHAVFGAPGFEHEKQDLYRLVAVRIAEAKRIQAERKCSFAEAMRLADPRLEEK